MFERLRKVLQIIISLDVNDVMFAILSKSDVKQLIIILNTDEQLFKGIDSTDTTLESIGGEYAPSTKDLKVLKGLPIDRVTLFDEGDFYDSFTVIPDKTGFTIEADTLKGSYDLQNDWGFNLIGLTDESKNELVEVIKDEIVDYIFKKIQ